MESRGRRSCRSLSTILNADTFKDKERKGKRKKQPPVTFSFTCAEYFLLHPEGKTLQKKLISCQRIFRILSVYPGLQNPSSSSADHIGLITGLLHFFALVRVPISGLDSAHLSADGRTERTVFV